MVFFDIYLKKIQEKVIEEAKWRYCLSR